MLFNTQVYRRFWKNPCVLGVSVLMLSSFLTGTVSAQEGKVLSIERLPQERATSVVTPLKKEAAITVVPLTIKTSMILGDDYPNWLKNAAPDSIIDPWRLYNRECVSFVAHRLEMTNGFKIPAAYGNAYEWGARAQREGYRVDQTPQVSSVAWWRSGHVAWVAEVKGNQVVIEEYNYGYNHRYNNRTVSISSVDGFIHFKDLSTSSVSSQQQNLKIQTMVTSNLPSSGTYRFTQRYPIRGEARVTSPELAFYDVGQTVNYDKVVEADGYKWISYISYHGSRRYIAVEKLQGVTSESKSETNPVLNRVTTQALPSQGSYRFTKTSGIQNSPSLSAPTIAYYNKGESVNYDSVVVKDGKQWISYISYSGARRYIAID